MDNLIRNNESEQALLAVVLFDPVQYKQLADIIKSDSFGWIPFGWVWAAMEKLTESGLQIDILTVADELERAGHLNEFSLPSGQFRGRAALSQLKELDTYETGEAYAILTEDYAGKRKINQWLKEALYWTSNGRTSSAIISDLQTSFGTLLLHSGKIMTHTVTSGQAGQAAIDLSEIASRGEQVMTTGLPDLDRLLYPQRGELITIAAQTGKGKSSLLGTIVLNSAKIGKRIKLFTLEMSSTQVAQRMLAQISGISATHIMQGKMSKDEWEKYREATQEFSQLHISICDLSAIRIGQIRTEARRSQIDILMVDYIQLANADKPKENRTLDVGEVTRGLKSLARELDIPVFAAAQLSRAVDGRGDKRPILSDLRESGSIEQDSDSVVFIWQDPIKLSTWELIIGKHRNGACGKVDAYFHAETTRFSSLAHEREINDYAN